MNWTEIEGRWHQVTGQVKSKWGKLTDDDLKVVDGNRERLVGKLQERYGVLKDDAEEQVDTWIAKFGAIFNPSKGNPSDPPAKATQAK